MPLFLAGQSFTQANRRRAVVPAAVAGGAFDPTDITGLQLWLDASDTGSITDAGSGAVSQWNDLSGNGRHFTQGTGANRPTTGTRTINSLNVVDFNGTTNRMETGSDFTVAQPLTIAWVTFNDTPTTTGGRVLCGRTGTGFQTASGDGSVGYRTGAVFAGGADFARGPADAITTARSVQVTAVVNGASTTVYVDGSAGSAFNAGSGSLAIGKIGARGDDALFFNGAIAEVIVYNSALGTTDRQNLEDYLATKWGTP